MKIEAHAIPGVMIGIEFVEQDENHFVVIDLLIVRILLIFGDK